MSFETINSIPEPVKKRSHDSACFLYDNNRVKEIVDNWERLDLDKVKPHNDQSFSLTYRLDVAEGILKQADLAGVDVKGLRRFLGDLRNKGLIFIISSDKGCNATISGMSELRKNFVEAMEWVAQAMRCLGRGWRKYRPLPEELSSTDPAKEWWDAIEEHLRHDKRAKKCLSSIQDLLDSSNRSEQYRHLHEQAQRKYHEVKEILTFHETFLVNFSSKKIEDIDETTTMIKKDAKEAIIICKEDCRKNLVRMIGWYMKYLWEVNLQHQFLEDRFTRQIETLLQSTQKKLKEAKTSTQAAQDKIALCLLQLEHHLDLFSKE